MAGEEQADELRDLVAQTLETQGVLGKIRAQLRASVFLALEEQETKTKPHPLVNDRLQNFLKTKDGQTTVGLVREFLEYFQLDFTTSVFEPETNSLYQGREQLATEIGLDPQAKDAPLLLTVLKKAQSSPLPELTIPSLTSGDNILAPPTLTAPITSPANQSTTTTALSSTLKPHPQAMPTTKPSDVKVDDVFADRIFSTTTESDVLSSILKKGKSKEDKTSDDFFSTITSTRFQTKHSNGMDEEESDDDTHGLSSIKYDTTDHSLSQTSTLAPGDFDYTENVQ